MYTSTAAAPNPNPILVALRGELAGTTTQQASTICARWFVDLNALVDLSDAAAPIRHAHRVLRRMVATS